MEQEHLIKTLEAILFVAGKPLKARELAKILELEESAVQQALANLAERKKDDGIVLLDNNGEFQLSTNSKYSPQVKNFLNAELREKLTDATVEVLAIIAYRQPISKAEIEAIRGVNSQYSVRSLLMRGLIEKIPNPHDARSFLYQTTTEFLMNLGLQSVGELPEFEKLVSQIKLPETPGLNQEAMTIDNPPDVPLVAAPASRDPISVTPILEHPDNSQMAVSAPEETVIQSELNNQPPAIKPEINPEIAAPAELAQPGEYGKFGDKAATEDSDAEDEDADEEE
ncbi:MAG: SMC-Scp complex subunit ScpB [Candidatus Doudnabacteria bacterium]|nr:SMC-Scp complex subunit ScpB [Candidatus Doudnabacteria bacterium]